MAPPLNLTDHLHQVEWSASVVVPAGIRQFMASLVAEEWLGGEVEAKVAVDNALPGFATLALDSGLGVTVRLGQPMGKGFRADIVLTVPVLGGTPGITLPGLVGGEPESSGSGKTLRRWVKSAEKPVKAGLDAVIRIEGLPGEVATLHVAPSADQPDGIVQVTVEPAHVLLPGDTFALHLPQGIVLDASGSTAPTPSSGSAGASADPLWQGLSIRGAELFLPQTVPFVGGTVVPVEFELGSPVGVFASVQVDVPVGDGRPRIRGSVEWNDPAALSLAACVPTLVDVSAEFDLDETSTPPTGPVSGAVLAAGKPLAIRARYARDLRTDPASQQFTVAVQGQGPDGLLRVAVDDGVTNNLGARVFVTAAALAGALVADTPPSTAPSGEPSSAGLAALLGVASVLSSFCEKGKVVVHGVAVLGTVGPSSPTLVLTVDYSVDILVKQISYGGLSIETQDDVPMRVRYRQVRLEIDPGADGLEKFHLSFGQASMEVEDPGRWKVPGAPFDVVGSRAGHGSVWFEIDLKFSLDLGPVKVSGATVRATFEDGPVPEVTIRGLAASLNIPKVLTGGGSLALTQEGFEATLAVAVEPLKLAASAYLALKEASGGTMIVLDLGVDLPGAIPLGPTGLGLYSVGGLFGFNARPKSLEPGVDPVEFQLNWTPAQTDFSAGDMMFGLAAVVGTLPDMGFAFSAAGRILLTVPNFAFRAGLDATFLSKRKQLAIQEEPTGAKPQKLVDPGRPIGRGAIIGVLAYDDNGVLIGLRGTYDLKPLLQILVPVDAVFPSSGPDWYIHVGSDGAHGRTPGPVQVKILPDLLDVGADAYLMMHGNGIPDVGGRQDFDLGGFAVAFGANFHAVYGAGLVWIELNADAQFGLGTAPLLVRGRGHLAGALHLGPVSVGASATIEAQVGPGDTRWAKFSVCGEVDLFFFELSGCVNISIGTEDTSVPPPDTWPLPTLSLSDHAYREIATVESSATAPAQPVQVWPDVIPLLQFPVIPGPTGFTSPQFLHALVKDNAWISSAPTISTATGRTGADDLAYTFTLTGLSLATADGTQISGELDAAWQQPRVPGSTATGPVSGELALLTWQTALWTSRLSDGGRSRPSNPLESIVDHCTIRPAPAAGWALGATAAPSMGSGEAWRMPPAPGPADPLMSRFWVDVDVQYRERPVLPILLDMPTAASYFPPGPVAFATPIAVADRAFAGGLAVAGLTAPGFWAHELGSVRLTLSIVDDQLMPETLVLLIENATMVDQIYLSANGVWAPPENVSHPDGGAILVYRCTHPEATTELALEYPLGLRVAVLGLKGTTHSASNAASAAASAAEAASDKVITTLGKSKDDRRTLLEAGTTYALTIRMHCTGQRIRSGTAQLPTDFGDQERTFWFGTAPIPALSPLPAHGYRVLGYTALEAIEKKYVATKRSAQDHFDTRYLERYLLGYTPQDRCSTHFSDDPVGVHFSVDHVAALARKYKHTVALALQRTDLPPATVHPPTRIATALWGALSAAAKSKQSMADQVLLELDVLRGGHCPIPHLGATLGANAGLVPAAAYDLAVQIPRLGEDLGIALPGIAFRTSRYRDPSRQLADLGFSTEFDLSATGGLPVPRLDLEGMAPTEPDTDAGLGVLLEAFGLSEWEPPDAQHGSCTVLWARSEAEVWEVVGALLESPEPLERPGRMRLEAMACVGVSFNIVRRNATSTRVLFATPQPVIPRRTGNLSLPPHLVVSLVEHPAVTAPLAPTAVTETRHTLHTVIPTQPEFAQEL